MRTGPARGARRSAWFVPLALLVVSFFAGALLPAEWTVRSLDWERRLVLSSHGEHGGHPVDERAARWVRSLIRTRVAESVLKGIGASAEASAVAPAAVRTWLRERGEVLQIMAYQFCYRGARLLLWLPPALPLALAALCDGLLTRRARGRSFAYSSPLRHRLAGAVLSLVLLAVPISLIAPLPLPPSALGFMLLAMMPFSLRAFIVHLPKRV